MTARTDWLLLFIGLPGGRFLTDQIRLMKGMFLLDQEGPPALRGLYSFQPYDYGPFDTQLYRDLDRLEVEGLAESAHISGTNRQIYKLTIGGGARVDDLLANEGDQAALAAVRETKKLVTSKSFTELLKYVYEKYPAYAARSLMR